MSTGLKILFNRTFGLLLAANAINIISQWSVLSLLTKFGLFEELGKFSLALAFMSPILVIASSQIKTFVAIDIENKYPINIYLSVRFYLFITSFIIAFFLSFYSYKEFLCPLLLFLIAKSIESMSDVCYGDRLRKNESSYIAISFVIRALIGWLGMSIISLWFKNLTIGLFYLCIINLALLILYDLPYKVDLLLLPFFEFKKILQKLLPLGIITTINSLSSNIPRIYIEKYWSLKDLAIYTNLSYVWVGAGYIAFTLGDSLIHKMSYLISSKKNNYIKEISKTMFLIFLGSIIFLSIFVYLGGGAFLKFIYNSETAIHNDTFLIIINLIPFSFLYPLIMNTLTKLQEIKLQFYIHLIFLISTILLSSFLIPRYGIKGAALAQLLSSMLLTLLGYFIVIKSLKKTKTLQNVIK